MPKIPLTQISNAPQLQGGVRVPDAGMISDAVGKAIQSAAISEMRGAMAAAEGEMEKGRAIAGLGKSLGGLFESFGALQQKEAALNGLETRLAFDQDLQRHYLNREEFEFANSNNPIQDGKNLFTDYAIKGIADLRKKYGDMELDERTAGYIAGQLSQHTIQSPAEARVNSIKQRSINFNSQYKTAVNNKDFAGAYNINNMAKQEGLINDTQFEAANFYIQAEERKDIRETGTMKVDALLLDNNVAEADKVFQDVQERGGYTDDEKAYNQSVYNNKKATTVIYNTTLDNSLTTPSAEYKKVEGELERRKQPDWQADPKDPYGLGRLTNIQLEDLKSKIGEVVQVKSGEQLKEQLRKIQDVPAGETLEQFNERLSQEAPELYDYDNGSLSDHLYEYKQSGKAGQGGITGYFLDKINDIDFTDQSVAGIAERGLLMDAIDEFTEGGVQAELKAQWNNREKLMTDPSSSPQVKEMEGMVDAFIESVKPEVPDIPLQQVGTKKIRQWEFLSPSTWGTPSKEVPVMGRPGKKQKQEIYDADGKLIEEKEVVVHDKDKSQEELIDEEYKTVGNAIKGQLRKNAAEGKYTKPDGTFNTELFRNDFNTIMIKVAPPEPTGIAPTPQELIDESENISPQAKRIKETGADIPMPAPPLMPSARDTPGAPAAPVPTPEPGAFVLPPVEELESVFNPPAPEPAKWSPGSGQAYPGQRLPHQFVVDNRTRDQLDSTQSIPGQRIVSLDYNSSSSGGNYAMIVIPNDATPEEREAAKLYVDAVTEWFTTNGVQVSKPIVKTTSENGRGVGGFFHTEPAFVQNRAAMALLQEKAGEYAGILADTLGVIPGTKFIPPHKVDDPGAGAPGILSERDFSKTYILPELEKIAGGGSSMAPLGAVPTAPSPLRATPIADNGQAISVNATAYGPKRGASNVAGAGGEGGYESSIPGPDGKAIVRTLDDILIGQSDYVTIAGSPEFYGNEYIIPEIAYIDKQGVRHVLTNVRAVVHDTGSAFEGAGEGRFDIAVARDASSAQISANHASWKDLQFVKA